MQINNIDNGVYLVYTAKNTKYIFNFNKHVFTRVPSEASANKIDDNVNIPFKSITVGEEGQPLVVKIPNGDKTQTRFSTPVKEIIPVVNGAS